MGAVSHSTEPWRAGHIVEKNDGCKAVVIKSRDNVTIAEAIFALPNESQSPRFEGNVNRIIACVNACVGYRTEVISGLNFKALFDGKDNAAVQLRNSVNVIQRDRDEIIDDLMALVRVARISGEPISIAAIERVIALSWGRHED